MRQRYRWRWSLQRSDKGSPLQEGAGRIFEVEMSIQEFIQFECLALKASKAKHGNTQPEQQHSGRR